MTIPTQKIPPNVVEFYTQMAPIVANHAKHRYSLVMDLEGMILVTASLASARNPGREMPGSCRARMGEVLRAMLDQLPGELKLLLGEQPECWLKLEFLEDSKQMKLPIGEAA